MNRIQRHLHEWQTNGLLTLEQREAIQRFEDARPGSNWATRSVLALGAVVISIGVVSVIAANWQAISPVTKLSAGFLLLAGAAVWTHRSRTQGRDLASEALLTFFLLLCLAMIGLIGQIYPSGAPFWQALLLWSAITLPAIFLARHRLIPHLWLAAFLAGASYQILEGGHIWGSEESKLAAVFVEIPLASAAIFIALSKWRATKNLALAGRNSMWITGLVGIAIADAWISSHPLNRPDWKVFAGNVPVAFFCAQHLAGWPRIRTTPSESVRMLIPLSYLGFFSLLLVPKVPTPIAGAITVFILGLAAIDASLSERRGLFNFLTFLIALRFLVFYFQTIGGLAATGVGLIASGVLIILGVLAWNRGKDRLRIWAKGAFR